MCGILGGIDLGGTVDRGVIDSALAAMQHRGPDAAGVYQSSPAFLGHRRLSIIDLDQRANQPLRVGPLVMSYNGEIYNFRSVRRDLEKLGLTFRTESDTEVIVNAFRHEGMRCLDRFEGMFAFAIWDEEKRVMTLARDRFGEKPLFYFLDGRSFYFASEILPLELLVGRDRLKLDAAAISLYFRFSFIPAPRAPFKGMYQLEPGTYLQFDVDSWTLRSERYYRLDPSPRIVSMDDAVTELRQRLSDSVRLRISASDVPAAVFLSGGIDSSIVAALAASSANGVCAYSIGFPEDPDFDESPYARMVAKSHPGMSHVVVEATEEKLIDFTDKTVSGLGEPYADASIIPTAFLCSHVEEKVVLGGDAADELFAGYGSYAAMRTSARLPQWIKRTLMQLPVSDNPAGIRSPALRAAALLQSHLGKTPMDEYLSWRSYVSADQLRALGFTESADPCEAVGARRLDTLSDLLALDIHFNLPNDMLKKVDLASMQYGVEVRLPYLDRQLAEFALSLPENLLINRGERKSVLRAAFRDLLPEAILSRRKQGFLLPIRQWLRKGRMRDELLELARRRSELDYASILRFSREHEIGAFDHSVLLWSCYVYLKWHERRN